MKKVLALVLAVVMVCTMAMALNIDTGNKLIVTGGSNLAKITLDPNVDIDFTETYYLPVPTAYFDYLGTVPTGKEIGDVYTVSGLNGAFSSDKKSYVVPVKVADKALDNVADLSLTPFTIKKDADNYATFKIVNNVFVLDKLVIGRMDKTLGAPSISEEANKLYANYDIGYAAHDVIDADGEKTVVNGWNYNNSSKATTVNLENNVTLTVPAKTYFTFKKVEGINIVPNLGLGDTAVVANGYTVSAGTIEYKIEATNGSNDLYYAVSKTSKVYTAGLTFVIEKNAVGVETGYWTLKTTDYPYAIFQGTKALNVTAIPGATTGTTGSTGTTTNPGTGANDVVGVAAALAVVALVSGAAISLKK